MNDERAEIVGARAIGIGVGLITLMLVWLVGNRLAALAWDPPVGPTVAFVGAIVIGTATAIVSGHRLAARVREERS
ncbi:MAG TPA: hypothetical protein VFT27_05235 [Actinomycetota bacterium]|nr:hypothetical protein [Actinomycetota bacterium]